MWAISLKRFENSSSSLHQVKRKMMQGYRMWKRKLFRSKILEESLNVDLVLIPLSSKSFSESVQVVSPELINIDTLKWQEQKASDNTMMHRVGVMTPNGKLVGFGMAVSGPWDPILKQGHFDITMQVDKDWRNQGIGSMLFDEVTQFAVSNGGTVLQCGVRETAIVELAWLEKRGFMKTLHTFESQLDLSIASFLTEKTDYPHVLFTSFADYPQDDVLLKRFFDFWWELATDAPGMEGKTQPEFDVMKKQFESIDREGFILAVDGGRWVAMSLIIKESDEMYYNSLTGVHREYRGKGLARAVKLKAIEFAKQQGAKFIRTHNDSNNIPMLHVNEKLGYEKKPGLYFLEMKIGK